jgi:S1-C subfamily serine protease
MPLRFLRKPLVTLAVMGFLAAPLLASDDGSPVGRPLLGIGTAAMKSDPAGVTVAHVEPEGPAAKAGLKKGDRIVMAGDKEIKNFEELTKALAECKPGDKLALKVVRDSKERTVTVTLGNVPARGLREKTSAPKSRAYLGAFVQSLTPDLKEHLGINVDKGVLVAQIFPDSPAAQAGLMEEDVVTHVGDVAVATAKELSDAIVQLGTGKEVELTVFRGKESIKLKTQLQEAPDPWIFSGEKAAWPEGLGALSDSPRPFFPGTGTALQKKVEELERRLHELEQKMIK